MGTCPGLGSAATAHAPLGLLVGSRSSTLRMAVGTVARSRLGGRSRMGAHSGLGTHSGLGACPGLGTTATAQASLGLLVASRSSPLRMAMELGAPIAVHQR